MDVAVAQIRAAAHHCRGTGSVCGDLLELCRSRQDESFEKRSEAMWNSPRKSPVAAVVCQSSSAFARDHAHLLTMTPCHSDSLGRVMKANLCTIHTDNTTRPSTHSCQRARWGQTHTRNMGRWPIMRRAAGVAGRSLTRARARARRGAGVAWLGASRRWWASPPRSAHRPSWRWAAARTTAPCPTRWTPSRRSRSTCRR